MVSDYFTEPKELTEFLQKLKEYREVLTNPESELLKSLVKEKGKSSISAKFPFLEAYFPKKSGDELKKEIIEELREGLVRKSSQLRQRITELTGTDEIVIHEYEQPRSVKVWNMGLRPEFDYRTSEALNACIDFTIQAIAKIEKLEEAEFEELWGTSTAKKPGEVESELIVKKDEKSKSFYKKVWYLFDYLWQVTVKNAFEGIINGLKKS